MTPKTKMDTLGFESRAFRMRSGCDTTTPCALEEKMREAVLKGKAEAKLEKRMGCAKRIMNVPHAN